MHVEQTFFLGVGSIMLLADLIEHGANCESQDSKSCIAGVYVAWAATHS